MSTPRTYHEFGVKLRRVLLFVVMPLKTRVVESVLAYFVDQKMFTLTEYLKITGLTDSPLPVILDPLLRFSFEKIKLRAAHC